MKKIVIVGAGYRGLFCKTICDYLNLDILCFFDNYVNENGFISEKIPILRPQKIENVYYILTAQKYEKELRRQLIDLGIDETDIVDLVFFLDKLNDNNALDLVVSKSREQICDRPSTIQFPITYRCNYNCVMCGVHDQSPKNDMTPESIRNILMDEFFQCVESVGINGGEPFIRDDLVECVESIIFSIPNLKQIIFISNGYYTQKIIDDLKKIIKIARKNGVLIMLSLSVDAFGELHDFHRGTKGAFSHLENTLREIKQEDCVDKINIITTITKYNIEKINEVVFWASENNIEVSYNIATENDRIANEMRMKKCGIMTDNHSKMLAQEFFYCKYLENGNERYYSLFQFIRSNRRVSDCPCMHNEWVTISPDGFLGLCAPHGPLLGKLNGNNARRLVETNIDKLLKIKKTYCDNCAQYSYNLNPYGYYLSMKE